MFLPGDFVPLPYFSKGSVLHAFASASASVLTQENGDFNDNTSYVDIRFNTVKDLNHWQLVKPIPRIQSNTCGEPLHGN